MSVLITGGGGGLARSIAVGFAARGVATALVDIAAEAAERNAAEIRTTTGVAAGSSRCDITDRGDVERAWDAMEAELGPVEHVVNCAGVFAPTDFWELSWAGWQRILGVNLHGSFHFSQLAVERWLAEGRNGSLVDIASNAALVSLDGLPAVDYGASKAAVVGLTRQIAAEFGPDGIRSNAVAPGRFRSPMSAARLGTAEAEEQSRLMTPLRRPGEAEEIAAAAVFLALDGTYVNGHLLVVDGGTVGRLRA